MLTTGRPPGTGTVVGTVVVVVVVVAPGDVVAPGSVVVVSGAAGVTFPTNLRGMVPLTTCARQSTAGRNKRTD